MSCTSPKLLELNQDYPIPQKIRFFLENSYKTEVMITSLVKKLELPNFGHMTTSKYDLSHMMIISW